MKTEKIVLKAAHEIINSVQPKNTQRVRLTQEPDILEIPRKKTSFSTYIKRYRSNLNKATVKEFEALPFEKYLEKAYELSSDTTGIPKNLRAPIVFTEANPSFAMTYDFGTNIIEINKNLNTKNRNVIFACFKHEHRHQLQNFNMMRTEGLGEEYIDFLAKLRTKSEYDCFTSVYRDMSSEKLEELKPQLGENYDFVQKYKAAVAQGQDAENAFIQEVSERDYILIHEQLSGFRAKVIEEMGVIPAGTVEAMTAKKHFDSIVNTAPTNLLSKKSVIKSFELEAYFATYVSYFEYLFAKFIK